MPRFPATLEDLLAEDDQPMDTDAMRWMVITWDIAVIDGKSNKYYRFMVADNTSLSLYSRRTPAAFSSSSPSRGTVGKFITRYNGPLAAALNKSSDKVREGYAMVCAPLAVNCATFADEVSTPEEMLQAIKDDSALGSRALAHVNATRVAAKDTHLASGTRFAFPDRSGDDLWVGI